MIINKNILSGIEYTEVNFEKDELKFFKNLLDNKIFYLNRILKFPTHFKKIDSSRIEEIIKKLESWSNKIKDFINA